MLGSTDSASDGPWGEGTTQHIVGEVDPLPAQPPPVRPVRIGVFKTVRDADRAVEGLLAAGFRKEHVSVVCSDRAREAHFREYEHDRPAGATTAASAGAGAIVGGVAAGLFAATIVVATGGLSLVVLGPLFAGSGAVIGTFVGAMMSRGVEHEVADYYDQALAGGEILVAAEIEHGEDPAKLDRASAALAEAGARPVALPQG